MWPEAVGCREAVGRGEEMLVVPYRVGKSSGRPTPPDGPWLTWMRGPVVGLGHDPWLSPPRVARVGERLP